MAPVRVHLDDRRRKQLIGALRSHFADHFDEDLSEFRAEGLLDFLLAEMAPAVYNQGVKDACAHLQEKLIDLEAEVYEPEPAADR